MSTSVRIPVKKSVLQWVVKNSGATLTSKWLDTIEPWLEGKREPTLNQLEQLSKKAQIPFGYFFLNEPPQEDLPLLKFRTVNNHQITQPSRNLIETIHDMETKQAWLSEYRQQQGLEKNFFVGAGRTKINQVLSNDAKAETIMTALGISAGWNFRKGTLNRFDYLRTKLDDIGVTVMYSGQVQNNTRRTLDQYEFRAFALTDDYAPFIFINSNDSFKAMLFSLVHELIHIWFGTAELFNADLDNPNDERDPVTEQTINAIAEKILFPKTLFITQWKGIENTDAIQKSISIAKAFGTSPLSAAIRAKRLKLIPQSVVDQLKKYLSEQYFHQKDESRNSNGHPTYYTVKAAHIDRAFARDVYRGARSGALPYSEAFELVNVKSTTAFDKLMDSIKGVK